MRQESSHSSKARVAIDGKEQALTVLRVDRSWNASRDSASRLLSVSIVRRSSQGDRRPVHSSIRDEARTVRVLDPEPRGNKGSGNTQRQSTLRRALSGTRLAGTCDLLGSRVRSGLAPSMDGAWSACCRSDRKAESRQGRSSNDAMGVRRWGRLQVRNR